MLKSVVTGRTRYRVEQRWFRSPLLVLQIEEFDYHSTVLDAHGGEDFPAQWVQNWRDATTEDLSILVGSLEPKS